jgi:HEPN domain-containing protein
LSRSEALRWLDEALWDLETALILHKEKGFNAAALYSH